MSKPGCRRVNHATLKFVCLRHVIRQCTSHSTRWSCRICVCHQWSDFPGAVNTHYTPPSSVHAACIRTSTFTSYQHYTLTHGLTEVPLEVKPTTLCSNRQSQTHQPPALWSTTPSSSIMTSESSASFAKFHSICSPEFLQSHKVSAS